MDTKRITAAILVLSLLLSGPGLASRAAAQSTAVVPPAPPAPSASAEGQPAADSSELTPARLSFLDGEVSFWRPGGEDWAPARLNTPLAPGDMLYTGPGGNLEVQFGPRAYLRATNGAQVGLDSQEPDFFQMRVTAGSVALDLRQLTPGSTVEIDTPGGAVTVDRPGYYHVDVAEDASSFRVYRGGSATVTPAGGSGAPIAANQQAVVTGAETTGLALGAAPALTPWDRWNYQRTDYLVQYADARYVSPGTYGTEMLNRYGTWRPTQNYGSVWVPSGVPAAWVPYSTGRWMWDPRFGWTWLDDAPWGWAPYHHGRWVFIDNYWAWTPGPVVVRAAYAPALVVFLGGASVSIGRPLCWAPLGWGEPVVPWWGHRGFVGVPWWGGWGGPRVVNNVVINRNTTVNVTNISVYRNVHVTNAVIGVPADHFGRGPVKVTRVNQEDVRQLRPAHGPLDVKPAPVSLMPATGKTIKPPPATQARPVVATRPRQDLTPVLREHGLNVNTPSAPVGSERIVPAPRPNRAEPKDGRPDTGAARGPVPGAGATAPTMPPQTPGPREGKADTGQRPAAPPLPGTAVPPPHGAQGIPDGRSAPGRSAAPPSAAPNITPPPPRDNGRQQTPAQPPHQAGIPDARRAPEPTTPAPQAPKIPPQPNPPGAPIGKGSPDRGAAVTPPPPGAPRPAPQPPQQGGSAPSPVPTPPRAAPPSRQTENIEGRRGRIPAPPPPPKIAPPSAPNAGPPAAHPPAPGPGKSPERPPATQPGAKAPSPARPAEQPSGAVTGRRETRVAPPPSPGPTIERSTPRLEPPARAKAPAKAPETAQQQPARAERNEAGPRNETGERSERR